MVHDDDEQAALFVAAVLPGEVVDGVAEGLQEHLALQVAAELGSRFVGAEQVGAERLLPLGHADLGGQRPQLPLIQACRASRPRLEDHRHGAGRLEEGARELARALDVELLTGVDIHAEEQLGRVPGVEVGARILPVHPSGPAVAVGLMGDRLHEQVHLADVRELLEISLDLILDDGPPALALDHQPPPQDHGGQIGHAVGTANDLHEGSIRCSFCRIERGELGHVGLYLLEGAVESID